MRIAVGTVRVVKKFPNAAILSQTSLSSMKVK